jgi:hypothetical protein
VSVFRGTRRAPRTKCVDEAHRSRDESDERRHSGEDRVEVACAEEERDERGDTGNQDGAWQLDPPEITLDRDDVLRGLDPVAHLGSIHAGG